VKSLSRANAYFIDTTYAAGLQECFDPKHPLTRVTDRKWKQELSDYARQVFGIFGSECGREWGIPYSDFFEGLTGVSGNYYHNTNLPAKLGAAVIPMFDLVYRDCIAMYGKYEYDINRSAEYVLHHISLARPLNYHSIPPHLYWKQAAGEERSLPSSPALFTRGDNGWTAGLHPLDRFVKNTYEVLSPLNEITATMQMSQHEFLTPDLKVQRTVFEDGPLAVEAIVNMSSSDYTCASTLGGEVTVPPNGFLVESPLFIAFCALNWAGLNYDAPTLFTMRSLDGKPLGASRKVRIYHGFGNSDLQLGMGLRPKTPLRVERETVLDPLAPQK
jgi:hypothetical protein